MKKILVFFMFLLSLTSFAERYFMVLMLQDIQKRQ